MPAHRDTDPPPPPDDCRSGGEDGDGTGGGADEIKTETKADNTDGTATNASGTGIGRNVERNWRGEAWSFTSHAWTTPYDKLELNVSYPFCVSALLLIPTTGVLLLSLLRSRGRTHARERQGGAQRRDHHDQPDLAGINTAHHARCRQGL